MWEAFEHAAFTGARQPDRDHRRQPARPAGRDDARLGPRVLHAPGAGVRLARDRDRRPRRRRDRPRLRGGGRDERAADGHRRQDDQGQGRRRGGGQERLPRQGARRPRGRDRRARRRAGHPRRGGESRSRTARRTASRPARSSFPATSSASEVATRKAYGEALAARGRRRRRRSSPSTARSPTRPTPRSSPRPTPSGTSRCTSPSSRWSRPRSGCRCAAGSRSPRRSRAFLTRAYDFVRMAAVSRANIRLCGSHAGVSIGEDGPSQMALEDLAMMRAVHWSTVLYPCDGNQTAKLVAAMADLDGIVLPADDPLGDAGALRPRRGVRDRRQPGRALLRRRRGGDRGGRHHRARGAQGRRRAGGGRHLGARDRLLLGQADRRRDAAGGRRGHRRPPRHRRGSLARGRARRGRAGGFRRREEAPRVTVLAVEGMPGSGKPDELLAAAGIDAEHIAEAAREPRPRGRGGPSD